MSGAWSGFTDEDIKKVRTGDNQTEGQSRRLIKAKRRDIQNTLRYNNSNISSKSVPKVLDVPKNAKLNSKIENTANEKMVGKTIVISDTKLENAVLEINTQSSVVLDMAKIDKRVIDLDEFQARQKMIEEQNRKRKELLTKALADRTKQTEEEAQKLKEIKNEFKKLDILLSNDVSILRHQIELASLEFMEAQKRYHKIEKDFLDSKLILHQKLERKEMLTEHLCAIIEKNEERKAEKLSELMHRLSVDENSVDLTKKSSESTEDAKLENNHNMIDEIKNRRELKIDLQPEKLSEPVTVIINGSE